MGVETSFLFKSVRFLMPYAIIIAHHHDTVNGRFGNKNDPQTVMILTRHFIS